jgi:HD-GYP domain-containing protein (c-di-GMP phosphodiesterase class II)
MRVVGKLDRIGHDDGVTSIEAPGLTNPRQRALDSADKKSQGIIDEVSGIRFPIRMKITLPYLILAFIIAMVGAYIVTQVVFDTIEERFTNQLLETGKIASESIVKEENKLLETLRLVAHTQGTAEALRDGNAEALREISLPILINSSVEALEIVDTSGTSILSLRHRKGDPLEIYDVSRGDSSFLHWDIVGSVLDQQVDGIGDKYAGIERAAWGDYLYVSGPIRDQDQSLGGVILIGDSLEKVGQEIRETTLSQVTIYDFDGQEITTTFIETGSKLGKEKVREVIARQDGESYLQEVSNANISYQEVLAPLEVRSGNDIGIIGTSLAKTFLVRASNVTRFQILAFAATAFLIIIASGLLIADRFTKPLLKVVDASSQVAAGNLDISVTPRGNDEVTALAKSFNLMVSSLQSSKSDLIRAHEDTVQAYDKTIEGWCKALELRDNVTEGHTQRVTDLTICIAREMGIGGEKLVHIRRGALMHDIGKMAIPDAILKKPSSLNSDEWNEIRKHPSYAYGMLSQISYLAPSLAIPYCHHEKWDGTGYPRGIKGKEIPLEARIFAVADVWDAISSERPYRKAMPAAKALQYIEENKGRHFDPRVVDAFLSVIDKFLRNEHEILSFTDSDEPLL